jgi:hypothetical protein
VFVRIYHFTYSIYILLSGKGMSGHFALFAFLNNGRETYKREKEKMQERGSGYPLGLGVRDTRAHAFWGDNRQC